MRPKSAYIANPGHAPYGEDLTMSIPPIPTVPNQPDASVVNFMQPLHPVHVFITVAALVTAAAQLIFVLNFFWSLKKGPIAPKNPWDATTLEWITDSPPAHDNFGGNYPSVYRGPYEFSVPGAAQDFIPQDVKPDAVQR